jgi:ankyrin repeat protein
VYAARANDLESVRILLGAAADVNQRTNYGWTPLLVAALNRYYKLGAYLLEHGANPNIANNGGWTPLYRAVDNRNVPDGDYPVRKPDMDHLEFIKLLLDRGADVNARVKDSTWTRTTFTQQWLYENGATAFLRAAQSSDLVVMRLLLEKGADPKISTEDNVTPLTVAAGVGWTEGITFEWSEAANIEAVKMLLDFGIDPNIQDDQGLTAVHGAAHKGHASVIQILVDHGGRLDIHDYGYGPTAFNFRGTGVTWLPVDYADGLVKVGTQQPIVQTEAGRLIRKLMAEKGLKPPPMGRTVDSVCVVGSCVGTQNDDHKN